MTKLPKALNHREYNMSLKSIVKKVIKRTNQPKFNPDWPFGSSPRADKSVYLELHRNACDKDFPKMDEFLSSYSIHVDEDWINELALHTQIVIKHSELNFQHGKLLYAVMRKMLNDNQEAKEITIVETGTARGFSAICMAKALVDVSRSGRIVTFDQLPHNRPIYWNCIDDHYGPKSRAELLNPWEKELSKILFVQGDTRKILPTIGIERINFAFLDACHTKEDVLLEYHYVADRQRKGDIIVFDDVTDGVFDGVVAAVDQIESEGYYSIKRLLVENNRGYALAIRN